MILSDLQILTLTGPELAPWLDDLGELRIRVFREYPYLYDGTVTYEREYLKTYLQSQKSLVVLVLQDGKLAGATTCLPLSDESPEFQAPFIAHGIPVTSVCYFGESILLPELRGQGLGKEFFTRREAHTRRLGLAWSAFCAVDRPENHPARPANYRPLDSFWHARGFEKRPDLQAHFTWKEIGEPTESANTLTFWMKPNLAKNEI